MKQIEEFLLPLNIVEELKGIGFDEPCIVYHTYDRLEFKRLTADHINPMEYTLIDWLIVFKWFRNKVNLDYSITFEYNPRQRVTMKKMRFLID